MTRTAALWIFFAALGARLLYLAFVYDGTASLMHDDSGLYVKIANWLLMNEPERAAAEIDHSRMIFERAPGYIYFVTGLNWLFNGSWLAVVLVQIVIDAATCVLTGFLAGLVHRRLVLPAGLIAAINFNMIVHAALILSDSLFLLPFVAGMIATLRYLDSPSTGDALAASVLFSLALLVRPVLLFFPPVLIAVLAFGAWRHRIGVRPAVVHAFAVPVVFLMLIGPVFLKNHEAFGHVAYTSQTGTHALFWVYPQSRELALGVPREQSLVEIRKRWFDYRDRTATPADRSNPFAQSAEQQGIAASAIRELGVTNLAKAWTIGTIINLSAPALVIAPPVREMERPSFYETTGTNPVDKIWRYLAAEPAFSLIILPAALLTVLVRVVTLIGLLQLVPRRWLSRFDLPEPVLRALPAATMALIALYVFTVTGPITGAKYRLPIEPISDIFLAAALIWICDIIRTRSREARDLA